MRNRFKKLLFVAVALFALLLGSCEHPDAVGEEDAQKLREIGVDFAVELRDVIVPAREKPEKLIDKGYVLRMDDKSYGADALEEFAASYDKPDDSQITIIFSSTSYVVARIVFTGGRGYYLRYQYDPFDPDDFTVSGQLVEAIDLSYQEKPPKFEMTLTYNKKQVAVFTFRNPE